MMRSLILLVTVFSVMLGLSLTTRDSAATSLLVERPLILEKDQGEVRVRRPIPGPTGGPQLPDVTFKVDSKNGGSPDFWFASETMPPGAVIPLHRHLHEDEILYIGSGTAHVHVGTLEGDAHAGAIVFIPRNTWVTVKNSGATPIALLFGFNAPGFDRYLRCRSVPKGQIITRMTPEEVAHCRQIGDVQYR